MYSDGVRARARTNARCGSDLPACPVLEETGKLWLGHGGPFGHRPVTLGGGERECRQMSRCVGRMGHGRRRHPGEDVPDDGVPVEQAGGDESDQHRHRGETDAGPRQGQREERGGAVIVGQVLQTLVLETEACPQPGVDVGVAGRHRTAGGADDVIGDDEAPAGYRPHPRLGDPGGQLRSPVVRIEVHRGLHQARPGRPVHESIVVGHGLDLVPQEEGGRGLRGHLAGQSGIQYGDLLLVAETAPAPPLLHAREAGFQFDGVGSALLRCECAQFLEHSGKVTGLNQFDQVHRAGSFVAFVMFVALVASWTMRAASTCLHGPRPPRYFAHHRHGQPSSPLSSAWTR